MARRNALAKRPSLEWGVRIALAIGVAWLGYESISQTLAYGTRVDAPERAHMLAPADGRVGAALAATLSGAEADRADRARADAIAATALLQDPTAIGAVTTLTINATIRGDEKSARRWFAYSEKLSRRNLRSRLWAIEYSVSRGDIPAALRNYDIALRTSRTAADLLYPVLTIAISESEIRGDLVKLLASKPAWASAFIDYATANSADPRVTADMVYRLHKKKFGISGATDAALIGRLVAGGHVDDAWLYYKAITPRAIRTSSRDPRFTSNLPNPSQFDWIPLGEDGISTSIQQTENGGLFDFSVPPSVGGWLLRQLQVLPAGNYLIAGVSNGIEQPLSSRPYWTLTCVDGRELGRVEISNSGEAKGHFKGSFTVSGECAAQYLTFVARASDSSKGTSGELREVQLRPAG